MSYVNEFISEVINALDSLEFNEHVKDGKHYFDVSSPYVTHHNVCFGDVIADIIKAATEYDCNGFSCSSDRKTFKITIEEKEIILTMKDDSYWI